MNLLPSDLKKLIGLYLPRSQIEGYISLLPQSVDFLLSRAILDLQLSQKLVREIWTYCRDFLGTTLSPYDHYLCTLSYFGMVSPGSEKFLDPKLCYDIAVANYDLESSYYFANLLGYDQKKVKAALGYSYSDVGKFYNGLKLFPKITKLYNQVLEGDPEAMDRAGIYKTQKLLALYGKYDLLEMLEEDGKLSADDVEENLFLRYVVKGNLKQLEQLFPTLPEDISKYIIYVLYSIYHISKNIKTEILEWLVHKLNIADFLNTIRNGYNKNPIVAKLFGLVYYYYPDAVKSYFSVNPMKFFNVTGLPIYFYLGCRLSPIFNYPATIKKQMAKINKIRYNPEDLDILIKTLEAYPNEKIGRKSAPQIAQTIIKKIKK